MKHLQYRKDFLHKTHRLNSQIKDSTLIKEYIENNTPMGDSYLGRLFSWGWRQIKFAYKSISLSQLLSDLEENLQNLLDRAKFEQVANDYPKLYLKYVLEQIKVVCKNSSLTDEDKLKALIGWDGVTQMYYESDPLKEIPGVWERKMFVNPCLIKDSYDLLTTAFMKPKIERALTQSVYKGFLDALTKLGDELRKLSEVKRTGSLSPTRSSTVVRPFNLTLLDILSKVASLTLDNFNHNFLRYSDFINENKSNLENLEELKAVSQNLSKILESDPEIEIENTDEYEQFVRILKNLNDDEKEVLKNNGLDKEIDDMVSKEKNPESSPIENEPIQTISDEPNVKTDDLSTTEIPPQKEIEVEKTIKKSEIVDDVTDKENLTQTTDDNPQPTTVVENPNSEEKTSQGLQGGTKPITPTTTMTSVPKFSSPSISTPKPKTIEQEEDSEKDIEEQEEDGFNPKQRTAENFKYRDYIKFILEATGPGASPGGSGTGVGPRPSGTRTRATTLTTVEKCWDVFFKDLDDRFPLELTKDDLDRLNSISNDDLVESYNFLEQPEPLLKIVRIFEKANRIFTFQTIPSCRKNGEVWSKTFNRYQYVGSSGSTGTPSMPGKGPWVYIPLFEDWKDGINTLMSNQKFKDLFQSLRLESKKINEASTEQIKLIGKLFAELTNIDNQGNFAKVATDALTNIFGLTVPQSKLITDIAAIIDEKQIDDDEIMPNSFIWKEFKNLRFDYVDLYQFFVFPINYKDKKLIFIQPININGNKVEIKFTYDYQGQALSKMKSMSPKTILDWSCDLSTSSEKEYVYYGVMVNDLSKFKICYANIQDTTTVSKTRISNLYVNNSNVGFGDIRSNDGKRLSPYKARLVYFDDNKKETVVKGSPNREIISRELGSSQFGDLKDSTGTKLYDALIKKGQDDKIW